MTSVGWRQETAQIKEFRGLRTNDVDASAKQETGPVECLGHTFPDPATRRTFFQERLMEMLRALHDHLGGVPFTDEEAAYERLRSTPLWPMGDEETLRATVRKMKARVRLEPGKDLLQLWKDIVGFPHGTIEDIVALSDPPYYTACPNPFLEEWIRIHGRPYDPAQDDYHREPLAVDVSEGKNDPIYNAHSYHTKVPPRAIMHYILHYTEPGDLIYDGFAGSGMTGVAAQLCGDRKAVESLGYRVDDDGVIYRREMGEEGEERWVAFSRLGARRAILNDLSPAATFIAYNYNTPVDVACFEREAKKILREVEDELGWMYTTLHQPSPEALQQALSALSEFTPAPATKNELSLEGVSTGKINYTVWSDVFICTNCGGEIVFWEAAVDQQAGKVRDSFPCPHCGVVHTKRTLERAWTTKYDPEIQETVRQAKQVPVLISYSVGKKRYEKKPDAFDLALIEKIEQSDIPYWFPTDRMPEGYNTEQPKVSHGITHVHHFYTKRNLWVLGALYSFAKNNPWREVAKKLTFFVQYATLGFAKISRYVPTHYSQVNQYLSGTLYVGSQQVEVSPWYILENKIQRLTTRELPKENNYKSTILESRDTGRLLYEENLIDYIFTDPPFGSNLMYSELNFLWESWLKVKTNNVPEAIENKVQGKTLQDYRQLMTESFRAYYRALKPGRWMTVVFHNSKSSVWQAIQLALQEAGFVVADVSVLDKQHGTFKQVTSANAVKKDLVISCYKPSEVMEREIRQQAGSEEGVWAFVRHHLGQLPVYQEQDGALVEVIERKDFMLYDRMIAYHVLHGFFVPISAGEFYKGLRARFPERDGMFFLPDQVAVYERAKLSLRSNEQLSLFIKDEASAIEWLREALRRKPQTYQELQPAYLKARGAWLRHEKELELLELLKENFLQYEGEGPIPRQIVSWLRQSAEMRERIDRALAEGKATDDPNRGLTIVDEAVIARARDRWYVPDPNKAVDLERIREKALLREFEEYLSTATRKLKVVRTEALRAGFKKAWRTKDYRTILEVAKKIPESILEEDERLLMWVLNARTRLEDE